ncbi:Seripauperin and TIP1 family protein [Saccharomyces cerevisiae]|nr:Seripauperin and TIP1 family protein [Saccharomyces cerevisiae]
MLNLTKESTWWNWVSTSLISELTWPNTTLPSRHPTETYPVEIAEAVFNYGDFTTMLTGIAPDQVTRMITGVPWYSTRLKPAISSALSKDGIYTIAN